MRPYITFTNGEPNFLSLDGLHHYESLETAINRQRYEYRNYGIICHCTSVSGTHSFRIK